MPMKFKTFLLYFVVVLAVFTLIFTSTSIGVDRFLAHQMQLESDPEKESDKTANTEIYPYFIEPGEDFADDYGVKERVNVLLLGIEDVRADTIMVASYDPELKNVVLLSIPRDTYFERSGHNNPGAKKINAAYSSEKEKSTGDAVSEILCGIPINYYMAITYDGVYSIVDSMGGVPVNVPFDMVYDDPKATPALKIRFKKGEQVLNGKQSVEYLRFRKGNKGHKGYPEGDLGRIQAQQEFMKSAFKQMLGFKLPAVASTVVKNLNTDISIGAAVKLATGAIGIAPSAITTFQVPGEAHTGEGGLSFFFADEAGISDLITSIYSDEFLKPTQDPGQN